MRWILCGKSDAAVEALGFLEGQDDTVLAIGTADDDGRDGWRRSFKAAAGRLGVAFEQPRRINAPDVVTRLASFGADALISIQYDQILRGALLEGIGCPCLNLHFALLPRHRGVAPIAWAILQRDAETGVTLHRMVEAIDAGDVLDQVAVPIGPTQTARELYDRVSEAAVELFLRSYPFPPELLAASLPQETANGCYHRAGEFDFAARQVDWQRPAAELQAWLRAMIFPPLQYPETTFEGRRLRIGRVGAELGQATQAPAGTVLSIYPDGMEVASGNGSVQLTELVDLDDPSAASGGILRLIATGQRFGQAPGGA